MANTTFGRAPAQAWPTSAAAAKSLSFGILGVQKGNGDPIHRKPSGESDYVSGNDTWLAESFNSSAASTQPAVEPTLHSSVKKSSQDKVELAIQKGLLLPSFRTRLCKYYSSRAPCAHGERCQFAHGVAELRVEAAIEQQCLPPGFKTRLCNNFLTRGSCPHSDCCHFAHGVPELRIEAAIQQGYLPASFKTKLCHFFTVEGCCSHCNRCHFAHGLGELRVEAAITQGVLPPTFKTRLCSFFAMHGQCPRGDFCHFAHGVTELRQEDVAVISALVGANVPVMPLQKNGVLQPGEAVVSNLSKWVSAEEGLAQDDIPGVPRTPSSTSLSQSSSSGASDSSSSNSIGAGPSSWRSGTTSYGSPTSANQMLPTAMGKAPPGAVSALASPSGSCDSSPAKPAGSHVQMNLHESL
eukprot:CAMPEP_0118935584 /NCGR_PEP_ID=MMETSP1169-20130426/15719_1 /TAXON_ID=36882 /ORGANISM="Pyramimonas obovata, Strain CCMP722" /LENGTH=409 /DNA_ID=CAMNT_0006878637 /DNA_START=505 /DNA_END=1731 /DNA_ORIENTATION=-